jgi:type IV secretory pathway VirJ component
MAALKTMNAMKAMKAMKALKATKAMKAMKAAKTMKAMKDMEAMKKPAAVAAKTKAKQAAVAAKTKAKPAAVAARAKRKTKPTAAVMVAPDFRIVPLPDITVGEIIDDQQSQSNAVEANFVPVLPEAFRDLSLEELIVEYSARGPRALRFYGR